MLFVCVHSCGLFGLRWGFRALGLCRFQEGQSEIDRERERERQRAWEKEHKGLAFARDPLCKAICERHMLREDTSRLTTRRQEDAAALQTVDLPISLNPKALRVHVLTAYRLCIYIHILTIYVCVYVDICIHTHI